MTHADWERLRPYLDYAGIAADVRAGRLPTVARAINARLATEGAGPVAPAGWAQALQLVPVADLAAWMRADLPPNGAP